MYIGHVLNRCLGLSLKTSFRRVRNSLRHRHTRLLRTAGRYKRLHCSRSRPDDIHRSLGRHGSTSTRPKTNHKNFYPSFPLWGDTTKRHRYHHTLQTFSTNDGTVRKESRRTRMWTIPAISFADDGNALHQEQSESLSQKQTSVSFPLWGDTTVSQWDDGPSRGRTRSRNCDLQSHRGMDPSPNTSRHCCRRADGWWSSHKLTSLELCHFDRELIRQRRRNWPIHLPQYSCVDVVIIIIMIISLRITWLARCSGLVVCEWIEFNAPPDTI